MLAVQPHRVPRPLGFLLSVLGLAVILALAAVPVARSLTRRLETLEAGVRRLGDGDLTTRVAVKGKDELASLTFSLDVTAERPQGLMEAQLRPKGRSRRRECAKSGYTSGILAMEAAMGIESKIQSWGNSQGVRFPKYLLEEVGLAVGDRVLIESDESGIVVRPLRRRARRHRISELVAAMPKDYRTHEEDWGPAEGSEVW